MFDEKEVIHAYTDEEAVEDGILVDISKYSNVITKATTNLLELKGYIKDEEVNIPNLRDLLMQCVMKISKDKGRDWFYSVRIEFPDGTSGKVFCAINGDRRYTVMLPEDY